MDTYDDHDIATQDTHTGDAPRAPEDRISRTLRLVAGGLLVVVLASAISFALYLQTLGAPRSSVERDIERYTTAVDEQPEILANHVKLAYSYAISDRFDEAMDIISRAEQMTKAPRVEVQLARAEIERAAGHYDKAIETYDLVARIAEDEYALQTAELKKQQIAFQPPNSTLAAALRGRSVAKWETGDRAAAIADLDEALDIEPTDAAAMVRIGGYYAQSNDTSLAAAAYRRALQFVPDDPGAIAGLRELGLRR